MHELKALLYGTVRGQIHLAAQYTEWGFMLLSKCPPEGCIFGAQRAKNETPSETPKLKVREVSQSGF